jgi:hypothetical protein
MRPDPVGARFIERLVLLKLMVFMRSRWYADLYPSLCLLYHLQYLNIYRYCAVRRHSGLLREYRDTKRVLRRMAALLILAIAAAIAAVRALPCTTINRFR